MIQKLLKEGISIKDRPRKCLDYLTSNEYFYKETGVKLE